MNPGGKTETCASIFGVTAFVVQNELQKQTPRVLTVICTAAHSRKAENQTLNDSEGSEQ